MDAARVSPDLSTPSRQISYFSLTAGGALLALKLRDEFGGTARLPACHSLGCGHCDPFDSIAEALPESFCAGDTVVCVMAAGIPFRLLAPYLNSKQTDPAVIVIDEEGRHVVPLLGGHAADANRLAREIADFTGGTAVLTTASDVRGLTAPDEVARGLGLIVDDQTELRRVTAALVDGGRVCIESRQDPGIPDYAWIAPGGAAEGFQGRLLITHLKAAGREAGAWPTGATGDDSAALVSARLIPRSVIAGIGCRRGAPTAEIMEAISSACSRWGVDARAIGVLASIDVKHDEVGLAEAAGLLGAETAFFSANRLARLERPGSSFVAETVGTPAVSEPAALLAAGAGATMISPKEAYGRVTVALALRRHDFEPRQAGVEPAGACRPAPGPAPGEAPGEASGSVFVVGTGAGTAAMLTEAAANALRAADIILGYRTYIEQIRDIFPDKPFSSGSMGAELDRCREAVDLARQGKTVALVSSGDPGVYGMAGPLLEMAGDVPVTIVPGVTAAQLAAASLGAPLMNDYITISLSDLLTPRDEVLRRARLAAESDLVVCLYNPTSKKRRPLFEQVCAILAQARPADTPTGWVLGAGGPGETSGIVPLAELAAQNIDMRTIVIVGNSRTRMIGGRMVTARGYERKQR